MKAKKELTTEQLKRKLSTGNHQMLLTTKKGQEIIVKVWKSLCYPDYSCFYKTDDYTFYNCSHIPIEEIAKMKYLRKLKETKESKSE